MTSMFHHKTFEDLESLSILKQSKKQTVSVVIPALNEEPTIGKIVSSIRDSCMTRNTVVDEIIVIDGMSDDKTVAIAKDCGALTYNCDDIGPQVPFKGKGVALWKSQFVSRSDIILFIDSDIVDFNERFVAGLLGPLLIDSEKVLVKSFYRRPLVFENNVYTDQGGRVTELLVRPLLKQCVPELSMIMQPLAGEYALRKSCLSELSLWSGYGIEIGILLDVFFRVGMRGIAQVDMGERVHRNRPLHELHAMANCILRVFLEIMHEQKRLTLSDEIHSLNLLQENTAFEQLTCDAKLQPFSSFCLQEYAK